MHMNMFVCAGQEVGSIVCMHACVCVRTHTGGAGGGSSGGGSSGGAGGVCVYVLK